MDKNKKSWQAYYDSMVGKARKNGIRVSQVSSRTLKDYAGMNSKAAKKMGFKMPANTVYIDKDLNLKTKCHTLDHELTEFRTMGKGKSYWKAHLYSLKEENKPR